MKNSLKKSVLTLMLGVSSIAFCGQAEMATPAVVKGALLEAVREDDISLAEKLLVAGANVNEIDDLGYTPLMQAAVSGDPKVVKLLLSYKADVNMVSWCYETALLWAVTGGSFVVASMLLEAGAKVDAANAAGETPLIRATYEVIGVMEVPFPGGEHTKDDKKKLQLLLSHGADINKADVNGDAPLMIAVKFNDLALTGFFLNHGARISKARNWLGMKKTALDYARQINNSAIVDLLEKALEKENIERAKLPWWQRWFGSR